jgi:hypothetical protein
MATRNAISIGLPLVLVLALAPPAARAMDKLGGPGAGAGDVSGGPGDGLPAPTPVGGTSSGGPAVGATGPASPAGGRPAAAGAGSPASAQREGRCVQMTPGEVARAAAPVYPAGRILYRRSPVLPAPDPGAFSPPAPGTIRVSPGC